MTSHRIILSVFIIAIVASFTAVIFHIFFWDPCQGMCDIPEYRTSKEEIITKEEQRLEPQAYVLKNGMRVFLLPTKFDDDEVQLRLISLNGYTGLDPSKRASAELALDIAWESGLDGLNSDQIAAKLYENGIELTSKIQPFYARIDASMNSDSLSKFLKMTKYVMQNARITEEGLQATKKKFKRTIRSKTKRREKDFEEIFKEYNQPNWKFLRTIREHQLVKMDLSSANQFLKDILSRPSEMILVIVGDFDKTTVIKEIEDSLGTIDNNTEKKTLIEFKPDVTFPKGVTKKTFELKQNTDLLTRITLPIRQNVTFEKMYSLEFLTDLIEERLRNELQQKEGTTFGIDVGFEFPLYPHLDGAWIVIQYRTTADKQEIVTEHIISNLKQLKKNNTSQNEINNVRKFILQSDEFWQLNNEYWVDNLSNYGMWNWPIETAAEKKNHLLALTPIQIEDIIKTYFNLDDYTIVIGKP